VGAEAAYVALVAALQNPACDMLYILCLVVSVLLLRMQAAASFDSTPLLSVYSTVGAMAT
jgi:hypothetical protein